MGDIVARLRNRWWVAPTDMEQLIADEAKEAADEIERLRSLNREMAEALEAVTEHLADTLTGPIISQFTNIDPAKVPTIMEARSVIKQVRP